MRREAGEPGGCLRQLPGPLGSTYLSDVGSIKKGTYAITDGIDFVTAVLESNTWRLCHSNFTGTETILTLGIIRQVTCREVRLTFTRSGGEPRSFGGIARPRTTHALECSFHACVDIEPVVDRPRRLLQREVDLREVVVLSRTAERDRLTVQTHRPSQTSTNPT